MSEEEKFKERLTELVESREFRFHESDWDAARRVIEREGRRGNPGMRALGALMFVISGVAFVLLHGAGSPVMANAPGIVQENSAVDSRNAETAVGSAASSERVQQHETGSGDQLVAPKRALIAQKQGPAQAGRSIIVPERTAVRQPAGEAPSDGSVVSTDGHVLQEQPIAPGAPQSPPAPIVQVTDTIMRIPKADANTVASNSGADTVAIRTVTVEVPVALPQQTVFAERAIPFEIEAGLAVNAGWRYSGKRDGTGISPVFGIHYLNRATEKLTLGLGLQYQQLNRLGYSSITSKVTRLGLGEESRVTVITPLAVHFIGVPVRARYDLDDKQQVGAGYTINYLLDVQSRVEKYSETSGERSDFTSYRTGGYTEGFRTFSSQLSVFYRRRVASAIWINGEFFIGLNDLKEDGFFGIVARERHSGIRLTLTYDLNKGKR